MANESGNPPQVSQALLIASHYLRQKVTHTVRPSSTPCRHTVSGLFHSPSGVLFTFPSRY
jgi:hypothetical protein